MIISELAYKVTIKADEFLNGKKKVSDEVAKLEKDFDRTGKNVNRTLKTSATDFTQFGNAAVSSFRGVTAAAAGFLGIGAGLYGIKQLFTSTANEIVRASTQAKFFGSDVNKMFGVRRGFQQAGLNGDAFIGASGSARMALANIQDPTIFGGLTGAAQNLMVLGARTGLNINQLGDPSKALSEFTRYSKTHSQENLMQVMSAAGFDPTDAAKIKSGELKSLVDSETKKSNITAEQVKEQENLVVKMGELGSQFDRIAQGLAIAFAPEVIEGMQAFGKWIESNQGNIIGFFREAGESVKKLSDSVGSATALLILLAVGLRANPLVIGAVAAAAASHGIDKVKDEASKKGMSTGEYLVREAQKEKTPLTIDDVKSFFHNLLSSEPEQRAQSSRRGGNRDPRHLNSAALPNLDETVSYREPPGVDSFGASTYSPDPARGKKLNIPDRSNNPGNLRPAGEKSGFRTFSSEQEGWDAMSRQLMMYYNGTSRAANYKQLRTVSDIINKWAPPSENETSSYVSEVAAYLGVGAHDPINLSDPDTMLRLRAAMARREGFSNWRNGLGGGVENNNASQLQVRAASNQESKHSRIDSSQENSSRINAVAGKAQPKNEYYLQSSDPGNVVSQQIPNINATVDKIRVEVAKREPIPSPQATNKDGDKSQYQGEYYLQQQKLADSRYSSAPSSVDNSKTSSTHIGTVVVNSNPQSVDALTNSINQQSQRAATVSSFSSAVGG